MVHCTQHVEVGDKIGVLAAIDHVRPLALLDVAGEVHVSPTGQGALEEEQRGVQLVERAELS